MYLFYSSTDLGSIVRVIRRTDDSYEAETEDFDGIGVVGASPATGGRTRAPVARRSGRKGPIHMRGLAIPKPCILCATRALMTDHSTVAQQAIDDIRAFAPSFGWTTPAVFTRWHLEYSTQKGAFCPVRHDNVVLTRSQMQCMNGGGIAGGGGEGFTCGTHANSDTSRTHRRPLLRPFR